MKIRVGLIGNAPGWDLLLRQEGISYISVSENFNPEEYSAIIVSKDCNTDKLETVTRYLQSGGSLLLSGTMFTNLFNIPCRRIPIQSLLSGKGSIYQSAGLIDIFTECYIPPGQNELPSLDGQKTTYAGEYGGGTVIVLPFDAGELALDSRTADKSFYSPYPRLPFEHISLVSKGALRRLVSQSLKYLHYRQGLPYLHKWYYPDDAPAIFSFRIDTDAADKTGIERVYDLSRNYDIPFSWFVDTKSQEHCIDIYSTMKGQEIGIHCYEHQTYTTYDENLKNINRAKSILKSVVPSIKGFAAPYGKWNNELAGAIRDAGFEYSSEFSYDYDNLPSFPVVDTTHTGALQIPIHPVSIGMLKRLSYSDEMMNMYFRNVIEQKLEQREPIILYHHPNDGHEQALAAIFKFIKGLQLRQIVFEEYASWWKKRDAIEYEAEFVNGSLMIRSKREDIGFSLHATRQDGTEAFIPFTTEQAPSEITWKHRTSPSPLPDDISRIRKFNPWISFIHLQDTIVGKFK